MKTGVIFISNVRCGSTHIVTTLGALPGQFADGEIKWRMPKLTSPAHLHLDPVAPSFSDLLNGFETDASFRGSKFILHPQNPIEEQDLSLLKNAVRAGHGDGLSFVLLERDYFEISASTLLRGNWNLLNSENTSTGSPSFRDVISDFETTKLKQKHPSGELGTDSSAIHTDEMAVLLLQLLSNDLMYVHMLDGLQSTFVQPYTSISEELPADAGSII